MKNLMKNSYILHGSKLNALARSPAPDYFRILLVLEHERRVGALLVGHLFINDLLLYPLHVLNTIQGYCNFARHCNPSILNFSHQMLEYDCLC